MCVEDVRACAKCVIYHIATSKLVVPFVAFTDSFAVQSAAKGRRVEAQSGAPHQESSGEGRKLVVGLSG